MEQLTSKLECMNEVKKRTKITSKKCDYLQTSEKNQKIYYYGSFK